VSDEMTFCEFIQELGLRIRFHEGGLSGTRFSLWGFGCGMTDLTPNNPTG
jgi:hypothetical protein